MWFGIKKRAMAARENELDIDFNKVLEVYMAADEDTDLNEQLRVFISNEKIIEEIIWFFPSTMFRLVFPEVGYIYPNHYEVMSFNTNKPKKYKLKDNATYLACVSFLRSAYLSKEQETKILSFSVEINVVNQLITKGSRMQDIVVAPLFVTHLD